MQEVFNKISDYALRVDLQHYEHTRGGVEKYDGYTRIFNFLSRQVTTTVRDWMMEGRGSSAGGTSALAAQTTIQSFDELPSDAELRYMHGKLIELGGTPPALEEVLPSGLHKHNAGLKPVPPR